MSYLLVGRYYGRIARLINNQPRPSVTSIHTSSSRANVCTRSLFRHVQKPPLKRVTKFSNYSLPLIQSSYLPSLLWNTFRSHGWKRGGKYWSSWWEKIVKSVNRRCLLCAGAIFLWDRERITNQEVSKSLSNYERRVSRKLLGAVTMTDYVTDKATEQETNVKNCNDNNSNDNNSNSSSKNDNIASDNPSSNNDISSTQDNNSTDESNKPSVAETISPINSDSADEQETTKKANSNQSKRPKRKTNPKSSSNHMTTKHKRSQHRTAKLKKTSKESEESKMKEITDSDKVQDDKTEQVNKVKESETMADNLIEKKVTSNDIDEQEDPMKGWELMSKQDNCTVYSKPYGDTGLFQYKVIGFYSDITAHDFLDVQITDDRMSWDSYCLSLKTIDRDSSTGSEVIHWVLKFPFPMSDRDYVFVRRHWISPNDDAIVIMNRAVDHPSVPVTRKYVRVKSYFSEMTIKPTTFIDEIGFHYELTYFDDPGTYVPSSAVSWVTKSAMPDYLNKIYKATVRRQSVLNEHKHVVA